MNIEPFSLDQLRVLAAVVETGSFSAAARRLKRVQSAVSYAVSTLEAQLDLALFDRSGKRPVLTKSGEALLSDVRAVLDKADALQARAAGLCRGLEAEVSLVVDVLYPGRILAGVLAELRASFPTVAVRLEIEALGAVAERVISGSAQIGILGEIAVTADRFSAVGLRPIRLVTVAAPGHPLAQMTGTIDPEAAAEHIQLVLTDSSPLTQGRDFGVVGRQTWRLGDLGAKHALLRSGAGWGTMPLHMVASDLSEGRLVRLHIASSPADGSLYQMYLTHRVDRALGAAGRWLWERLREADLAKE